LLLHIGIDDTDSPLKGCTTYIAALIVEEIFSLGGQFVDYPNLLRLNPNVPWKTRGNGACCLRIEVDSLLEERVKTMVLRLVDALSDFDCRNTNPGVIFHTGNIPDSLIDYSNKVVSGVVKLEEALQIVEEVGACSVGYGNMRGIIGALAAVGGLQKEDHTYEFLAYREAKNCGKSRKLDLDSVKRMDRASKGLTYNNVDAESGRVLIAPHGPDPVFFGIRGETPESVFKAGTSLVTDEPIERWVIFRSNQMTDAHFRRRMLISDLKAYHPAIVNGSVAEYPRTIKGGHVFFTLVNEKARIDCAAYEPTGKFREKVRQLIPGDVVEVYGGVRINGNRKTFNIEKMEILSLAPDVKYLNPSCPSCGRRMESMGRGKGFRCKRCGFRARNQKKVVVEKKRVLHSGFYIPEPKAQRHLTKPLQRYGKEKEYFTKKLIDPWHWP
jgi:tRNA(Ile2)-agmatinylcytidine synthase